MTLQAHKIIFPTDEQLQRKMVKYTNMIAYLDFLDV